MMMTRKRTIGFLLTACLLTVGFASVYAKGGNPFDELWTHIFDTDARVEELEAEITELKDLIESIPEGPEGPPGPGFGELIHDSGWLRINPIEKLEICTLKDTNVFVYMVGRHAFEGNWKLHQAFLGGDRNQIPEREEIGAYWYVSGKKPYTLNVYRLSCDPNWEEVRVLVWQLPS